jgi:hypothetical protein
MNASGIEAQVFRLEFGFEAEGLLTFITSRQWRNDTNPFLIFQPRTITRIAYQTIGLEPRRRLFAYQVTKLRHQFQVNQNDVRIGSATVT